MPLLLTGAALCMLGILAIYSVSIYESFTTTLKFVGSAGREEPTNYFYFNRQIFYLILGTVLSFLVYKIPLKFFQRKQVIIGIGIFALIFQLLVFSPLGVDFNGARGRLDLRKIGLGTTLQPSEFFKLGYIIFVAGWLVRKQSLMRSQEFFVAFAVLNFCLLFVFLLIPDLGTVLVLSLVGIIMARYAGVQAKRILIIGLIGSLLGILVGMQFGYIRARLNNFIFPDANNDQQIGRQTKQALIAVGGGGMIGQGYGKGMQKFGFLPEAQSDFIFAAFSEEIGFLGNLVLIGLYLILAALFLMKLGTIKDEYTRILGVGLISAILVQAFVNMGVNIRLLPATGLTLPFISSGGTALIVNMIQVVLMYKILYQNANKSTSTIAMQTTGKSQLGNHSKIVLH